MWGGIRIHTTTPHPTIVILPRRTALMLMLYISSTVMRYTRTLQHLKKMKWTYILK